ncbi:hypothetical protein Syun_013995 [Stephania yunnanensis]|uniref:SNF2 N-terminal domain-containing protein n=1 Tax=Stephania yunnanensis TaxID=152371 RepID=A0AAP0PBD2_9MAGN
MRVDIYCVSISFLLHLFIVGVRIWLAEIEGLLWSSEVYHSQFSLLNEVGEFLTIVNSNKSSLLLLIRLLYRNRVLGLSQPLMFLKPNEFFWQMGLGKTLQARYPLPFDVFLTTYDIVLMDQDFLSQIRWTYAVIDEAQQLKNSSSSLALSVGDWFFDRVGVSAIDCPYPCATHQVVSNRSLFILATVIADILEARVESS